MDDEVPLIWDEMKQLSKAQHLLRGKVSAANHNRPVVPVHSVLALSTDDMTNYAHVGVGTKQECCHGKGVRRDHGITSEHQKKARIMNCKFVEK